MTPADEGPRPGSPPESGLMTVGHGTASEEELLSTLRSAGVTTVVDIRRFPGSARHPQMSRDAMARWLPAAGTGYRWEPALGGRRRLPAGTASADTWWTVEAFRAYAAWTRTPEFADALAGVLSQAAVEVVAVLCSETLWWRCHRRLVADVAVLVHGVPVRHVLPPATVRAHPVAAGARLTPERSVVWDGARE